MLNVFRFPIYLAFILTSNVTVKYNESLKAASTYLGMRILP